MHSQQTGEITAHEFVTAEAWLEVVRRRVAAIRFGSVQIMVHDGRVTQVEAVERTRFVPDKTAAAISKAEQA